MRLPLEPDVVSSDSTNSVREQFRQVNQRIDEVQRDFVRSKEEVGETTKGGSPFAPQILDKPIPSNFRLPALEPYDGSTDPTEHVAVFKAQMVLYDTSDALMCHTFPMTLRGPARMWYSRIKPFSISSFDQFAKEFKLNFITSSCPRSTAASLLGLTQGNDEPLAQFVSRFLTEIRRMPDTHPTMAIQAFLMGLGPSRFFWSLIERPPSTVPEMLQRASQYVTVESLVVGKREDHKKSRRDKPQGQSSGTPRRRDRLELPAPRPLPIPLNSTRTEDPRITFAEGDDVYSDHDEALVISAQIANAQRRAPAHLQALEYKKVIIRLYNYRVCPREIKTGDLVLRKAEVSDPTRSRGQLTAKWEGPYRVETSPREDTFTLTTMEGKRLPKTWHISNL
ncbi:hypothetical protein B296_00011140 [Ensete ventricosum]|uniref:Retrotransposon gag domain-containing protein n=1 Tax=Ensete ventricosum TaxID=4639 RepID=A0A427AFV9_ENSVE|nr:hypothetical protein B296_00011140 [Ensete ventricosum]